MTGQDVTRFVLLGPTLRAPRVLVKAYAIERQHQYAERLIQSVDGETSELAGSGQRIYVPIELDCYVQPPQGELWTRRTLARELAGLLSDIEVATSVQFGDLSLPVYRIRVVTRAPTGNGYRIRLRLYSNQHEFTDADGNPVPLA
ncbi:hypothetical protein [Deinococcus actinosclerus]|uniref:Uncharacterized protein n=1 Tax=Deinococcus actinosclerus TaxID=1768108 RepID=A0ABM5X7L8_9DEIO|nr:hypothetical protein [Deinococcus actinosclerus]ALW89611.1 hypothetical protein AUC44_12480 [Deinococcus actinosclerus]